MKLFNWNTLSYEKFAKTDVAYITVNLPIDYETMPYMEYYIKLKQCIDTLLQDKLSNDIPIFIEFNVQEDVDLIALGLSVSAILVQNLVTSERRDREYRLGAPNNTYKMLITEMLIKALTNYKSKLNTFGFELKYNRKKIRMI